MTNHTVNSHAWTELCHVATVMADPRYGYRVSIRQRGRQQRVNIDKLVRSDAPAGTKGPRNHHSINLPVSALPRLISALQSALEAEGRAA